MWPVIVLNLMTLALVWVLRFFVSLPLFLALEFHNRHDISYLSRLVRSFRSLVFLIATLQIFALNAVILKARIFQELDPPRIFDDKEHWIVVLETAILQIALSLMVWFVFVVTLLVAFLPLLFLILPRPSHLRNPPRVQHDRRINRFCSRSCSRGHFHDSTPIRNMDISVPTTWRRRSRTKSIAYSAVYSDSSKYRRLEEICLNQAEKSAVH